MSEARGVPSLTITYDNASPVELADLTVSLQSVARRYARFAAQNHLDLEEDSAKLYVRRIAAGSIVVDLTNLAMAHKEIVGTVGAVAAGSVLVATQTNALVTFAKNMRDGLNYLCGKSDKKTELPANELRDLARIVEPVAKDINGSFSIVANDGASIQVSVHYNSLEANTIQNRAEKEIEERREPGQKRFKQVLMYWHQASREAGSRTDRAVIDAIYEKPLKVVFDDEDQEIKNRMISGQSNPFTIGFLVDVELLTIRGRPVAYKVTHLYEVLADDPEDLGGE